MSVGMEKLCVSKAWLRRGEMSALIYTFTAEHFSERLCLKKAKQKNVREMKGRTCSEA